jgi:hypothetical protein
MYIKKLGVTKLWKTKRITKINGLIRLFLGVANTNYM